MLSFSLSICLLDYRPLKTNAARRKLVILLVWLT